MADSVVFRDTEAADHGLRLVWILSEELDHFYNALSGDPPPECAVTGGGGLCWPPPPFDSAHISDSVLSGSLRVRAYLPGESAVTLSLSAKHSDLDPWIRRTTFTVGDSIWAQAEVAPDTTTITLSVMSGVSTPAVGRGVSITGEFVPGTGGHAHLQQRLAFSDAPLSPLAAQPFAPKAVGRPITGFFTQGEDSVGLLTDTTDSNGEVAFVLVPGFVSGEVDVIASTTVDGNPIADTLRITIRKAGLTNLLEYPTAQANAYFVGGTADSTYNPPLSLHPQDSIWFVTASFADSVAAVLSAMARGGRYPQVNDASLPYGGAFTVDPALTASGARIADPWKPHRSHALGIDLDLGLCYATTSGENDQIDRISPPCPPGQSLNSNALEQAARSRGLRLVREGDHYHLRPFSTLTFAGTP